MANRIFLRLIIAVPSSFPKGIVARVAGLSARCPQNHLLFHTKAPDLGETIDILSVDVCFLCVYQVTTFSV